MYVKSLNLTPSADVCEIVKFANQFLNGHRYMYYDLEMGCETSTHAQSQNAS
jgi:hypothetical protein